MALSHKKFDLTRSLRFCLPYAELMRIDKPVGILNIFFPYFYGFAFTVLTSEPKPNLSQIVPAKLWHLFFSTFILRSMGCAWNDIVDMDLDRQVERTKTRPLARGAVSPTIAYCFTSGLLAIWTASLIPLAPKSIQTGTYAVLLLMLVLLYPYMKRFTDYAQVVLGITLGFGILFGATFGGFDILLAIHQTAVDAMRAKDTVPLVQTLDDPRTLGLMLLYAAYLDWTVIHDTVYAFQDLRDDKKIGLKSLAIRTFRRTKFILSLLGVLQVSLLGMTAIVMQSSPHPVSNIWFRGEVLDMVRDVWKMQWPFVLLAVAGNAAILPCFIIKVDLTDPGSCGWWFRTSSTLIGCSIGAGFAFQYVFETLK